MVTDKLYIFFDKPFCIPFFRNIPLHSPYSKITCFSSASHCTLSSSKTYACRLKALKPARLVSDQSKHYGQALRLFKVFSLHVDKPFRDVSNKPYDSSESSSSGAGARLPNLYASSESSSSGAGARAGGIIESGLAKPFLPPDFMAALERLGVTRSLSSLAIFFTTL